MGDRHSAMEREKALLIRPPAVSRGHRSLPTSLPPAVPVRSRRAPRPARHPPPSRPAGPRSEVTRRRLFVAKWPLVQLPRGGDGPPLIAGRMSVRAGGGAELPSAHITGQLTLTPDTDT